MNNLTLGQKTRIGGCDVAFGVTGSGPPLVLVHGFPSSSFIWRNIVHRLAKFRTVYIYDLPGQGQSEKRLHMDVSDPAQTKVFKGLLDTWGLDRPAIASHNVGCAYALRAHYFEDCQYERVALISPALLNPCVSPETRHAQAHLEAYSTMPYQLYEAIVSERFRSITSRPLTDEVFATYLDPWLGAEGQAAWYNRIGQIDERHFARLESRLGAMDVPVQIISGAEDKWVPAGQPERLKALISNAKLHIVEGGGQLVMEDAPERVATLLADFFKPA